MGKVSTSFKPGVSGNPGGRPKILGEIKDLARQYGPGAISKLAEMSGLVANRPGAENESARIAAIRELLDRGYGKAAQPISGDPDGAPLAIDFRWADALTTEREGDAIEVSGSAALITFADSNERST